MKDLDPSLRGFLEDHAVPNVEGNPWTIPAPPEDQRLALVSTAGLKLADDEPFTVDSADYRVIPLDRADDVIADHLSVSHDRTGFMQDINTTFPLPLLRELVKNGEIGSLADWHYSFMGATSPVEMEPAARSLSAILKQDGVNTVLLAPV